MKDKLITKMKKMVRLPKLYEDSYEAVRLAKGNVWLFSFGVLLIILSIFEETKHLLRLNLTIILPLILIGQAVLAITTLIYKKFGFYSKIFQYFDLLNKLTLITTITIIIYSTNDPRTAWWLPYFLFIVLVAQLGEFHWFYFTIFMLYPSVIATLYVNCYPELPFSMLHKSFPYYLGLISGFFYYYQCRVQWNEMVIKENNLNLINELSSVKMNLERERISRELHDTLGASLTGNIIYTEIAKEELYKNKEKTIKMLNLIEALSREALVKMREAIYSIMEDKELLNNFSQYVSKKCQQLLDMKKIDFLYDCPTVVNDVLSPKAKFNLYRVISEWLTNVLKHSEAPIVSMRFFLSDQCLKMVISDTGKGFDQHGSGSKGEGLKNIAFRIQEIGGEVVITSDVGKGSQLHVKLPI